MSMVDWDIMRRPSLTWDLRGILGAVVYSFWVWWAIAYGCFLVERDLRRSETCQ